MWTPVLLLPSFDAQLFALSVVPRLSLQSVSVSEIEFLSLLPIVWNFVKVQRI